MMPTFCPAQKGHIGLQIHPGDVLLIRFKDI